MRLKKIEISNFRSIEAAVIELEPRCRTLVGKNEVGKSNILAACALIDSKQRVQVGDLRETRVGEAPVESGYVRFVFSLSAQEKLRAKKSFLKSIVGGAKIEASWSGKKWQLADFFDSYDEWLLVVPIPSGVRYQGSWRKVGAQLSGAWLAPKEDSTGEIDDGSGKSRSLDSIRLIAAELVPDERRDEFDEPSSEALLLAVKSSLHSVVSRSIPKCLVWSYSENNLLPASIDIEEFKSDPTSCEPLRAIFLLAGHDDAAQAITKAQEKDHGLRNLLSRVAKKATEHIRTSWKEQAGIEITLSPNGAMIDAAVQDTYNQFSFHRRSDGFKRFVSFLILVSARVSTKDLSEVLFLQDEPDLGLHPSGIRSLLHELIKLSSNNYVITSTHSIFLVDKERIDRHLIVSKENETTTVSIPNRSRIQDEEVLFNALGYSLFELVKPVNIVFEGWRDKKLFATFSKKRTPQSKALSKKLGSALGCVHAMGVKDIMKVVSYFDAIDRMCIVVTDSDQVAKQKQAEVTAQRPHLTWKTYEELSGKVGVLTSEDFVKPVVLRKAFASVLDGEGLAVEVPRTAFDVRNDTGVVSEALEVLKLAGVDGERSKVVLNAWKSKIFDTLEPSEICTTYEQVANEISLLVEAIQRA